jgi:hypothetical protein
MQRAKIKRVIFPIKVHSERVPIILCEFAVHLIPLTKATKYRGYSGKNKGIKKPSLGDGLNSIKKKNWFMVTCNLKLYT